MLWLILGKDKNKRDSFIKKELGVHVAQRLDSFTWEDDYVRGFIESNSLFGNEENVLIFDTISENESAYKLLLELTPQIRDSKKKFFIIENDLSEEDEEIFKKEKINIVDYREEKKAFKKWENEKYNSFALPDAVGRKSAKDAWIEYEKARMALGTPEELHARVWGKVRDMIAANYGSVEESGLHPFVYKKAKADLKNWNEESLNKFIELLIDVYHESRMGVVELDIGMEKLLLGI